MKNYIFISCLVLTFTLPSTAQSADSLTIAQDRLVQRADSLIANFKFEKALNVLFKGDTLRTDVLLRTGQCHARLGASGLAIRPYEQVLRIDSDNVAALNQLGLLYARSGDFTKALSAFAKLIQLDSTNSYYHKQAGIMAAQSGNTASARYWFRKALNLNPTDTEASLALGNILLEMEQYKSVDSIVLQALAVDARFRPLLLLQARSAFEQQQFESAIIVINELLEKSDTTIQFARMLSVSFFNLHEYEKLTTCVSFLLKNRYEPEWAYYYMGVASRELGDVRASIEWFKLAVQKSISDNTKTYYTQLGQSYEKTGDYAAAIRAYKAAYNQSKEGILLYHLARNYDIYYQDKSTALLYYQKYLESEDTIRLTRLYARQRMQDMGKF